MDAVVIAHALKALVPDCGAEPTTAVDRPTIVVPVSQLSAVAAALRDAAEFRFALLVDIVGVDFLPREPRFEVNYVLVSPDRDQPLQLRVKVCLDGADPHLPTLTGLWPSCGFLEREVWDLLGIVFDGHADLRRLLTPDDWEGHPLRKDYPVQIKMPVQTESPLQLTAEQFRDNLAHDRRTRGGAGA